MGILIGRRFLAQKRSLEALIPRLLMSLRVAGVALRVWYGSRACRRKTVVLITDVGGRAS